MNMKKKIQCYYCDENCDVSEDQLQICNNAIMCWKMTTMNADGTRNSHRGCVANRMSQSFYCNTKTNLRLKNRSEKAITGLYHTECCKENLCNNGSFPFLPGPNQEPENENFSDRFVLETNMIGIIAGLAFIGLITILTVFYGVYSCYRRRRRDPSDLEAKRNEGRSFSEPPPFSTPHHLSLSVKEVSQELRYTTPGDSTIQEFHDGLGSITSGSGAGRPLLIQQTLSKQVSLVECMSKGSGGSFGREIWQGIRLGEKVAVKVYNSRDEAVWAHEMDIYSKLMTSRHENILGFIGSDVVSRCDCTQLWLVTDYYPSGSLFRYLSEQPKLDYSQMFNICLSIVNGLLYLHTEILGSCSDDAKPIMAHRNLNSKTVLVKGNGICVISDLSHAITQDKLMAETTDRFKEVSKLYMAPEMLEETFNSNRLEDFCYSDVYSLALIFWEVCCKCTSKDMVLDYMSPYADILGNNAEPTFDEMRKLVVDDQSRPFIPSHWSVEITLTKMESVIQECWSTKASARLPILRIKKTLINLASKNPDVQLAIDID